MQPPNDIWEAHGAQMFACTARVPFNTSVMAAIPIKKWQEWYEFYDICDMNFILLFQIYWWRKIY